jgi:hypothetical protein
MAGAAAARGHGALLTPSHRRETARTLAGGAAAARRYRPLFPRVHGRKTARPAVKGAAARGSDLASPQQTHGRKTAWTMMKRAPAQRGDFTLPFWVHRRKTAPPLARRIFFVAPPAAWCPESILQKIKPIVAPRGTIARGNFLLPCSCHNIPFSLATETISIVFLNVLAGCMPASPKRGFDRRNAASISIEFCKIAAGETPAAFLDFFADFP